MDAGPPTGGPQTEPPAEAQGEPVSTLLSAVATITNSLGLSEQETNKLKYVSSMICETTLPTLSQSFELNQDDAAKFALALKLLASVSVPEKVLEKVNPQKPQPIRAPAYPTPAPYGHYPPPPYPPMYPPYPGYGAPAPGQAHMPYVGSVLGITHTHTPKDFRMPLSDAKPSDCTIYIRGLPTQCTEPEVVSVFCNFGTIRDIRMQMDKETNTFIGSVFIEFLTPTAAKLAKTQMDKKLWSDKTLYIDFAKERMNPTKPPPPTGRPEGLRYLTQPGPPSPSLYISGLPLDLDREALRALFSRFGVVEDCRILTDTTGGSRGIAFLDYEVQESATMAIDYMNESTLGGKLMRVQYAMSAKRKGGPLDQSGAKRPRVDAYAPPPYPPYDPMMYYGAAPPPGHYY